MEENKAIQLHKKNTREQNEKVLESALWNSEEVRTMRESVKRKYGFDMKDPKQFPVMESSFSWKKVKAKFGEADSASGFTQVLRAGIQTAVNSSYQTVPTTFQDWTHTIQSNKQEELYAPLHGITFPREVGRQEVYPESKAAGLDIKLQNRKYGTMYPVEEELLMEES